MEIDKEVSESTKPRTAIGCLKIIGWGLVILALLAIIGVFWNETRMESKLQKTLAELDRTDPGWRFEDIEAAREEVPEEENSARVIVAAAEKMPQRWPPADFPEERLRLLPSNETLSGEDFVRLSQALASARTALGDAERVADMPRGRHQIHYARNPIATLLPHLQQCRNLVSLLAYESTRRNYKGDSKGALTACRAALNVARSIGDEPIYISQLVRTACVSIVCQAIERTLGHGEPSLEDLTDMQRILETEDAFPASLIAARGERAQSHKLFEGVESGELAAEGLEGPPRAGTQSDRLKNMLISLWRMDTHADHALYLSLMTRRLKDAQLPLHEQASLEITFDEDFRSLPKNAMITRLLMPALSKIGEGFRRKHAYIRCMIVALAAERYRREKKTWPDNIEKLCPQFLAAVPRDPFDGKPLRYRRAGDGVVIYSVGQDVTDDGGNLDRERPTSPGADLGFRLWDVNKRRQSPKPREDQPPQGPNPP